MALALAGVIGGAAIVAAEDHALAAALHVLTAIEADLGFDGHDAGCCNNS